MQDDRPLPGQGCACREKSGVEASGGRIFGNLGSRVSRISLINFGVGFQPFEFLRIVNAGNSSRPAKDLEVCAPRRQPLV